MCSAGEYWLIGVSVAQAAEEGHGAFGEVAAGDGPFVVLAPHALVASEPTVMLLTLLEP